MISGDEKAIDQLETHWQEQERKTKRLTVSHAFHSPLIEPMLEPFAEVVGSLDLNAPTLPVISNTTGEQLTPEQATDPAYWVSHARQPVRFADAVATLKEQGATTYLELGPDAVLTAMATGTLAEDENAALIPTLREGRDEPEAIVLALGASWAAGAKLDREALFAGTGATRVPLPTYPFQRQRFWLDPTSGGSDPSAIGQAATGHPLLSAAIEDPEGESILLTGRISLQSHPWLADHAAAGTVLLPGAALVELALEAGARAGCKAIEELTLPAPLLLPESGGVRLQVKVGPPGEAGGREVSIHSRPDADEAQWSCNARGILAVEPPEPAALPAEWPPDGAEPIDLDFLYDRLAEAGLDYGPAFQGLDAAWRRGEEIYAEVSLAPEQAREANRWGVHPALFDAAFHGALLDSLADGDGQAPSLPFAWEGVALHARGASSLRVCTAIGEGEGASFALADGEGRPLAQIGSLHMRPVPAQALGGAKPRGGLLALNWSELTAEADAQGAGQVELLPLAELEIGDSADAPTRAHAAARAALALIQQRIAEERPEAPTLALLTNAAVATSTDDDPDLAGATVWGLLRSAQGEHPGRFALIDSDGSDASAAAIPAALARCTEEPQLALRDGRLLAPRIGAPEVGDALPAPLGPWTLDAPTRGTLDGLTLVPAPQALAPLAPGQVRVAVRAGGLNFRDVMSVLGIYPGEVSIGGEGAGVVVEVGPGVSDFAVGDRVLGMMPGAFGPWAVAEAGLLTPVPDGWSFEQGAALPLVHLTARFGLVDLACLQAGERVLIHAGAGGVGMAAIQLARHLGAEVFATASPNKWAALREARCRRGSHRLIARPRLQGQRFLEQTGGKGVDVVLNALAGDFVDTSLDLLPRGGRFLEMGKTDVRDPERVAADHPGVSYRAFDLAEAGPERTGEMLGEIVAMVARAEIQPSPLSAWDVRDAVAAFRHLREGHNVGKVVLTVPQAIDPERTVLITGGTGALGALTARHLVEAHGARRSAPGESQRLLGGRLRRRRGAAAAVGCRGADRDLRRLEPGSARGIARLDRPRAPARRRDPHRRRDR